VAWRRYKSFPSGISRVLLFGHVPGNSTGVLSLIKADYIIDEEGRVYVKMNLMRAIEGVILDTLY
jgi:hypothetical protein